MAVEVHRFATRADWLAARQFGIGGSDAATICGHGYGSEYALWAGKCGLTPIDSDGVPEYVEAGNVLEPAILGWWGARTGEPVEPTPLTILRDPSTPWMFASPDALVGDDAGLDAKNASEWRAEEFDDGVPLAYQLQATHYLAVTGRARWHFACLVGGNRLKLSTVERDERLIEVLVAAERKWWDDHVVGRRPPEPDGSEATRRAIGRAWPSHVEGEVRPLGADFLPVALRLAAAKDEMKGLKDEIDELENKVKAAIGEAESGVMPSGDGWTLKRQDRGEYVVKATSFRVLRYKAATAAKGRR